MGEFLARVLEPFAHLTAYNGDLYWPYILSFLVIAVAASFVARSSRRPKTIRQLLAFLFPMAIYRHRSAQLDFRYFIINTLLYTLLVVPLTVTSAAVARPVLWGLVQLFGVPQSPLASGPAASIFAAAVVVLASDLGFFLAHYMQHHVPVLWVFHKAHHSAEVLHPITSFRSHPVDLFVDFTLMGAMTGLAMAALAYGFDANLTRATILGANAFVFAYNLAGANLRHSHIRLGYGPLLSRLFVSPAMHQVHHSFADAHRDKNLGGIFAVWDWTLGSLYVPRPREPLTLGLAPKERRRFRTVADLYFTPVDDLAQMLRGPLASGRDRSLVPRRIRLFGPKRSPDSSVGG